MFNNFVKSSLFAIIGLIIGISPKSTEAQQRQQHHNTQIRPQQQRQSIRSMYVQNTRPVIVNRPQQRHFTPTLVYHTQPLFYTPSVIYREPVMQRESFIISQPACRPRPIVIYTEPLYFGHSHDRFIIDFNFGFVEHCDYYGCWYDWK